MGPSNFRYEPYNDIPTGVEITERHVIPANSPYYIRLNEVPQKNSPSTMSIKEITAISTTVTYGMTFNEVAANPAAGEFWPDCNTGANGDENWNTGLITFNAADAEKIIEVSYTGTGTLAAVNSNHWPSWYTDRGDGSDGDFTPTGNTTISGVKNYKSVHIPQGVTVTVDYHARICCQDSFVNKGIITSDGKGSTGWEVYLLTGSGTAYRGTSGACGKGSLHTKYNSKEEAAGLGHVINGRRYTKEAADSIIIKTGYIAVGAAAAYAGDNSTRPTDGNGGGSIQIICKEFTNTGTISSNGLGGYFSDMGGCGGGGSVIVIAETANDSGTIEAKAKPTGSYAKDTEDGLVKIIELGAI